MASEVDICNMAIGYLGGDATISSISPPDGTAEADHCARFYPIARNTLLEIHAWGFATKRVSLALLAENPPSTWQYAYQLPSDQLNVLAVLDPAAPDDYSVGMPAYGSITGVTSSSIGKYTPQPYTLEVDASGNNIVLTNQANAVMRYTAMVTDPTTFSPLFIEALAWFLASKIAGPLLKGKTGMQAAIASLQMFEKFRALATTSDANQQKHNVPEQTTWMNNR